MAAVLFGESMTLPQIIGGIGILGGVLFYSRTEQGR
jgi:drug/metabolite transporter (DMT)-like permease